MRGALPPRHVRTCVTLGPRGNM